MLLPNTHATSCLSLKVNPSLPCALSVDRAVSVSRDHRLCGDLRVTPATKPKEESEHVKAKQSKISIIRPLQSFALSFQGVEVVILLPNGRIKWCQQFSTK